MVGEIRDKETAEIAMKASQTGHLVLSTLHTNDSLSAVTRLLDLGIPGFLIASSVTAILSQRLVRRLCRCHGRAEVTPELAGRLRAIGPVGGSARGLADQVETVSVPGACDECDQTGYRGRMGIYEIVAFDESIRGAVREGEKIEEVRSYARNVGMSALDKIAQGITSVEEVLRVVPMEARGQAQCPVCRRRITRNVKFCPHCGSRQETEGMPGNSAAHSEVEVTRP